MDSTKIVEACRFIGEHWTGDDGDLVTQAADYISRLEAVVRAADELGQEAVAEQVVCVHYGLTKSVSVKTHAERASNYWNARARVTLPPLTQTTQAKDVDKEDASNAT